MDKNQNSPSSKPLSAEERAAYESRLAELKANQAHKASQNNAEEDMYQEPDEYDHWEEEFLNDIEKGAYDTRADVPIQNDFVPDFENGFGELEGEIIPTDKAVKRQNIGDFELLRLAKMGDLQSFVEFSEMTGISIPSFSDNYERNALHYAVDSGNAKLVETLITKYSVPYRSDQKGMTPLDIASLNGFDRNHPVVKLVMSAAENGTLAGASIDNRGLKTVDEAVIAFAPAPPRLVVSKPSPKPPADKTCKSLWKAETDKENHTYSVESVSLTKENVASWKNVFSNLNRDRSYYGLDQWLSLSINVISGAKVVYASSQTGGVCAAVVLCAFSSDLKIKSSPESKQVFSPQSTLVLHYIAVSPDHRGRGLVRCLLHSAIQQFGGGKEMGVFFRLPFQLFKPLTPVSTIKWFRRALKTSSIYSSGSDLASEVFPDFYEYEEVLRADHAAKGTIPSTLRTILSSAIKGWCLVDSNDFTQVEAAYDFFSKQNAKANDSIQVEILSKEVFAELFLSTGKNMYVYVSPESGKVTDLIVLNQRTTAHPSKNITAVICEYALFSSIQGEKKVQHIQMIANDLLNASVLFIPTLFGITDKELSMGLMDELPLHREFLYFIKEDGLTSASPTKPSPTFSLPFIFL